MLSRVKDEAVFILREYSPIQASAGLLTDSVTEETVFSWMLAFHKLFASPIGQILNTALVLKASEA